MLQRIAAHSDRMPTGSRSIDSGSLAWAGKDASVYRSTGGGVSVGRDGATDGTVANRTATAEIEHRVVQNRNGDETQVELQRPCYPT